MKKTLLTIFFLCCLTFNFTFAQALKDLTDKLQTTVINVSTEGEAFYPANIITLQIFMQINAASPGEAFEKHKNLEKTLTGLITGFGIQDTNIVFEPFRISHIRNNRESEYRTNQLVQLTLKDFDMYEEIQVILIENDFDNFQASFQSSENIKGDRESLQNAIDNANMKAELIAAELGLEIRNIASVDYSESGPSFPVLRTESMRAAGTPSLMNIPQIVKFTSRVTIQFHAAKKN
ncbi:MAG: SIMPL domain-containing protein [Balneolaceae bacterium]